MSHWIKKFMKDKKNQYIYRLFNQDEKLIILNLSGIRKQ